MSINLDGRCVPRSVAAVMAALHFSRPRPELLAALSQTEWKEALHFSDNAHVTLELARRFRGMFPAEIEERLAANLANNAIRMRRLERDFSEIEASLAQARIDFVVLKGFSHWPGDEASSYRAQYDVDLYCPPEHIESAKLALSGLGYLPLAGFDHVALDHLPAMVRPSEWQWRGDYFDVEFPLFVDLHFRLWDRGTERIAAPGMEAFWERRTVGGRPGFRFPALAPVDLIAYASLHLLRHLLRGDLRPFHVYDIAWFLHTRAGDDEYWEQWATAHEAAVRRLQFVVFRLAQSWFGCRLPGAAQRGIAELPRGVHLWFTQYSASPLEREFQPNKSELWLHLSLLETAKDRGAVLLHRLLPSRLPPPGEAQVDRAKIDAWRYWRRTIVRLLYHLKVLVPVCFEGLRFGVLLQKSKNTPPVIG